MLALAHPGSWELILCIPPSGFSEVSHVGSLESATGGNVYIMPIGIRQPRLRIRVGWLVGFIREPVLKRLPEHHGYCEEGYGLE